jgi:hypothetical protein
MRCYNDMWGIFAARPRSIVATSHGWSTPETWLTYLRACALAFEASTEIVHHDARAAAAEEDGVFATQSPAGTRHHDRLAVIPQL